MRTPLFIVLFVAFAAFAETTNVSVELGGKWMALADIDRLVREQAKIEFHLDFEGAVRDVKFHTGEGPVVVSFFFQHPDGFHHVHAQVDRQGKVWCQPMFVCGTAAYRASLRRTPSELTSSQYSWTRAWIERHTATNNTPVAQRVFVLRESRPRAAFILEHRSGMTLHDVIAQTPYKDSVATVQVFRPTGPTEGERLSSNSPQARSFQIHALDLVTIYGSEREK